MIDHCSSIFLFFFGIPSIMNPYSVCSASSGANLRNIQIAHWRSNSFLNYSLCGKGMSCFLDGWLSSVFELQCDVFVIPNSFFRRIAAHISSRQHAIFLSLTRLNDCDFLRLKFFRVFFLCVLVSSTVTK